MKKIKSKQGVFFIISVVLLLMIIAIGPMDVFTHGYYYDEINIEEAAEDLDVPIELSQGDYEMHFSPAKKHFAGVEILMRNQPDENCGTLVMTIKERNGKVLDIINVDLSKVKDNIWYKTYVSAKLKPGQVYSLTFSLRGCEATPSLVTIDRDYLREETLDGNVALAYAYKESTFDFQTKSLIFLFAISLWLWVACKILIKDNFGKKLISKFSLFMFMTGVLTWNYMYNSMDNANSGFDNFEEFSETFVTSVILAEENDVWFTEAGHIGFGLGRYHDKFGGYYSYVRTPVSDDDWNKGYSKTESAFIINSNEYTNEVIQDIDLVRFSNGNTFRVIEIINDWKNIVIRLEADRSLNSEKYGGVEDIVFINSKKEEYKPAILTAYTSQYGLQGKIFRRLARYIADDIEIETLHLLCALATATVFSVIVLLMVAKYNPLLACISFITFLLAPCVVNFARNLYWVEFTWFIPMAVGVFCTYKINDRKCRYIAAFLAITMKCLCGYEYISSIMMGLISFMLVDFIAAITKRDKEKAKLLFRTIVIIGFVALLGFMAAICIHAPLRAEGNILGGIKNIFEQDVLKRTRGGDLNDFSPVLWESFNTSVWKVFCKYFKFPTEVVTGVAGNLFPLLCCSPLVIFAYEYHKKKLNIDMVAMYIVFFLTSVSWFCLAKSHSYIHYSQNYVMWYMGFVQTCFYIIVNKIAEVCRKSKEDDK